MSARIAFGALLALASATSALAQDDGYVLTMPDTQEKLVRLRAGYSYQVTYFRGLEVPYHFELTISDGPSGLKELRYSVADGGGRGVCRGLVSIRESFVAVPALEFQCTDTRRDDAMDFKILKTEARPTG